MTHPVDAQLPSQVVSASINLLHIVVLRIFTQNQREFLTAGGICHEFALKVFFDKHWGENCMPWVFFLGIHVRVRELLLVVVAPAKQVSLICYRQVMAVA
jgi:hypothetical protein